VNLLRGSLRVRLEAILNGEANALVELAFSILAADFAHLADEIARAERGGGTIVHVDVMDGHFVPNITFGPPVVEAT
jgi:pentose-5-phosphate-3-epimerase